MLMPFSSPCRTLRETLHHPKSIPILLQEVLMENQKTLKSQVHNYSNFKNLKIPDFIKRM